MEQWELALEALDDLRDEAVSTGETESARELIRWACKVARSEVNTPVRTSEIWLTDHATGESTAKFHARYWDAIDAWVDSLEDPIGFLEDRSLEASWDRWDYLQDNVRGLGPTKAAMACAMLGDKLGCIDRHMAADLLGEPTTILEGSKRVANPVVAQGYKRLTKRSAYIATHNAAFGDGDARYSQWASFWNLTGTESKGNPGREFQASSHMPFFTIIFDAMLGARYVA